MAKEMKKIVSSTKEKFSKTASESSQYEVQLPATLLWSRHIL